jgi:hypothetical protein
MGKLIECRDRRNEGDARRTCDPEIEFLSGTFIGEIPNPVGKSGWRFREAARFLGRRVLRKVSGSGSATNVPEPILDRR